MELLIARNPDAESALPFLLRLPIGEGLVFRSQLVFTTARGKQVRPAVICDGLAELQVRWPAVPLVFGETRKLAEEWTYRYVAAACTWAEEEPHALERLTPAARPAPATPAPTSSSTAQIRAWAPQHGLEVADRGRLRPEVLAAFQNAQP